MNVQPQTSNELSCEESYDCELPEFLTIESMLESDDYINFINDKPIDRIITCVKEKKGANLEEIQKDLNYPLQFISYVLDITTRYWNTYFNYGRIILNESDNKYYHISKTDPRASDRKISIIVYE